MKLGTTASTESVKEREICQRPERQFPISRTAVSKHLCVLAGAGLVERQRRCRQQPYRLRPEPLVEVKEWLAFYGQFWDKGIGRLKRLVEPEG